MNRDARRLSTAWARGGGVALALVAAGTLAVLLLARAVTTARALGAAQARPATPDQVLQGLAAAAAGSLLLWLVAGAAMAAIATAPGALGRAAQRASLHVTPLLVRGLVAALLGGVVASATGTAVLGTPGPATAPAAYHSSGASPGSGPLTEWPDPGWADDTLPSPGWTPQRPPPPTAKPAEVGLVSAAPAAGRATEDDVVVRRGDTLWAIAARHLGRRASAGEIASAWPRWYAANRAVIGPEPDLLQPGQILHPPATHSGEHS